MTHNNLHVLEKSSEVKQDVLFFYFDSQMMQLNAIPGWP